MPPSQVGGEVPSSPARRFYAKRLLSRSLRRPTTLNTPVTFGVPDKARAEDALSFRSNILGPLVESHHPVIPDGSRQNLLAAFDKRCNFYSDKRVHPSVVRASKKLLLRICPSAMEPIDWTPELFSTWNSQFAPAKQARHLKVFPLVREITSKQFSNKEIFVKVEALLKRHDSTWAPRIINQSSDIHNVVLGPIMQACTKRMFNGFGQENSPTKVNYKGAYKASTQSLADYIERHGTKNSVFIESDFSSNDMTQLRDVHLLEVAWLQQLGAPMWLTSLMLIANEYMVSNYKHSIRGKVSNQLPTGAQSTTFRNSMWNASINHAFALDVKARGDVLILGDDMLMRYDNCVSRRQQVRRRYERIVQLAGMIGKVSVRSTLAECEFLSKQFIPVGARHVMVPKLGKAIARFNARASTNEAVSDRLYIAGKALSYAYEFRAAPSLSRAFLLRYVQASPNGEVSLDGLGWNAKGAFLDLGVKGVLAALDNVKLFANLDCLTAFYHRRYSLTYTDVYAVVLNMLFGSQDLSDEMVGQLISDWV